MKRSIFIGFDPREADAFTVCERSIRRHLSIPAPIRAINLDDMRARGLYWRPTQYAVNERGPVMQDVISCAPMSTAFAISRFLTPVLAETGWALFMDCDMLVRADLAELFALADDRYAVMVVKHDYRPAQAAKMDNQPQTAYPRKNWSSVMLMRADHPAMKALTVDMINTLPGRDLHSFSWLDDALIGELPREWNHLVGVNEPNPDAKIVHHTLGVPSMKGYEAAEFAAEWWAEMNGVRACA